MFFILILLLGPSRSSSARVSEAGTLAPLQVAVEAWWA